ncbi:hypothetical protein Pelo_18935 [Pelomyxa schiedti]|nr:hypothetical protein Pelo_18935 [Pelomyxa schiedti]
MGGGTSRVLRGVFGGVVGVVGWLSHNVVNLNTLYNYNVADVARISGLLDVPVLLILGGIALFFKHVKDILLGVVSILLAIVVIVLEKPIGSLRARLNSYSALHSGTYVMYALAVHFRTISDWPLR